MPFLISAHNRCLVMNHLFVCYFECASACACCHFISITESPSSSSMLPHLFFPSHYLCFCRCLSLSFRIVIFPRKRSPGVWSWIKKRVTQSVSEQAFSWGKKSMIYPWRWDGNFWLLEVALCIRKWPG